LYYLLVAYITCYMPKEVFNYHVRVLDLQNFTFVPVSDFFQLFQASRWIIFVTYSLVGAPIKYTEKKGWWRVSAFLLYSFTLVIGSLCKWPVLKLNVNSTDPCGSYWTFHCASEWKLVCSTQVDRTLPRSSVT